MNRFAPIPALGSFAAWTLAAGTAAAVDPPPPPKLDPVKQEYVDKPDLKDDSKRKQGWDPRLIVGAQLSFANNSGVVGQPDGSSVALGVKLDVTADYNREKHEWRNTLGIAAGMTRSPLIEEFVKTTDILHLDSIYLYHVVKWVGPFVRVSMDTQMFRGKDVRPAPVTYSIARVGDPTNPELVIGSRLRLSDPFKPLTLRQSVGGFLQPLSYEKVSLELRAGFGAQETFANSQLAVVDDALTPAVVEIQELQNVYQGGPELALAVWGTFADKKVSYKAEIAAMTPVLHSPLPQDSKLTTFGLTNLQMGATLSFKLVEWASLDYQFKAVRLPQVVDLFQVQNALLLTFGLTVPQPPPPPPVCPPPPPAAPPPPPAAPPAPAPAAR